MSTNHQSQNKEVQKLKWLFFKSRFKSEKNISNSSTDLFPCKLDEEIEKKLSILSTELVKNWGDRQLTVLDLDDRIATAAEKAPTDDKSIKLCENLY